MKSNAKTVTALLCLACVLLSGRKTEKADIAQNENKITYADYNAVLEKGGILDDVIDFKNEFCAGYLGNGELLVNEYETNNLKIVNIDTGEQRHIADLIKSNDRFMCSWRFDDDWFVWSEDEESDLRIGQSIGKEWQLKAFNIYTNETITIDGETENLPKERSFYATPINFSVDSNGVAYKSYIQDGDNLFEAINYFDFNTKESVIIDKMLYQNGDNDKTILDAPYICSNIILYGKYKLGKDYAEGTAFMYDIKNKNSKKFDKEMLFELTANGKNIVAIERKKSREVNGSILIMDYNGNVCNKITNDIYKSDKDRPSELVELKLSDNYLVWRNVKETQLDVFNISDNTMYEIFNPNSGRNVIGIDLFNNNFLIWSEMSGESQVTHNYALLK